MKQKVSLMLLILLSIPSITHAYSDYIIASGENIGITVKTNGVLVVGTYTVGNELIIADSGLHIGDLITKVENQKVSTSDELLKKINSDECNNLNITYTRNNKEYNTKLRLKKENNICKTGLYVKDSITGVGTLTFIDPNTKIYGALGHEVIESQTGKIVESNDGTIFESTVTNIEKSRNGEPGEKNAIYDQNKIYGSIKENTIKGIFGNYTKEFDKNKLYKVAKPDEIYLGKAVIKTVIKDNIIKEYSINIQKVDNNDITKNLIFEITDESLINETGGIVQGMSGSPIIQDDKIIGAVTHVFVNNPKKGYGIFITNMLEEAEN